MSSYRSIEGWCERQEAVHTDQELQRRWNGYVWPWELEQADQSEDWYDTLSNI